MTTKQEILNKLSFEVLMVVLALMPTFVAEKVLTDYAKSLQTR